VTVTAPSVDIATGPAPTFGDDCLLFGDCNFFGDVIVAKSTLSRRGSSTESVFGDLTDAIFGDGAFGDSLVGDAALGDFFGDLSGEAILGDVLGDVCFGDFAGTLSASGVTRSELLPKRCTTPASVVMGEITNSTV
jgi:hypothetical protein